MALTDGLILHFGMQDNAASTTVVAAVGSNGTAARNTSLTSVTGPNAALSRAFRGDGLSDYVSFGTINFASGDNASVRLIFKRPASGFALCGQAGSYANQVYTIADTFIRVADNAINYKDWIVPSQGTTNWHDLVITKTGTSYRVYLDGAQSSSGARTLASSWQLNAVARSGSYGSAPIASFSAWSLALSGAEIAELHNGGNWLAYPFATGPSPAVLANYYRQLRNN